MDTRTFCLRVGQNLKMTREEVFEVWQEAMREAQRLLSEGDEVRLPGIGKLYCKVREARPHLDRFKLAQGIEEVIQLPERKQIALEPDEMKAAMFARFPRFEQTLNGEEPKPCTK